MKRFLISSIIFPIILLTSCLSPAVSAPMPTVTHAPSGTPSMTPTETPTPIPTEVPFPTEGKIVEIVKSLEGTDYGMKWNNDNTAIVLTYINPDDTGEIIEIPEITFDEKGEWKRTYTFETPYGTTAEVSIDSRIDKMIIVKGEDEKSILDFSAWSVIDGNWTREEIKGEIAYNVAEAQTMLIENGSQDPKNRVEGLPTLHAYRLAVFPNAYGRWFEGQIKFHNAVFTVKNTHSTTQWWGVDVKGLDDNNEKLVIETTFYSVINFITKDSLMIYKDKNSVYQVVIMDADLTDWGNWSPYFLIY